MELLLFFFIDRHNGRCVCHIFLFCVVIGCMFKAKTPENENLLTVRIVCLFFFYVLTYNERVKEEKKRFYPDPGGVWCLSLQYLYHEKMF